MASLADQIDAALPQTQCARCGYPDCRSYAEAIAQSQTGINRCPPGGVDGVLRLATLTGQPALPLDDTCGVEGPLTVAVIDETWCIGCTLCLKACPVDCIVGTHKQMHTVVESHCTGCELCLPACPVDCIALEVVTPGRSGWQAWTAQQADEARSRYLARNTRNAQHSDTKAGHALGESLDTLAPQREVSSEITHKRSVIEAALARSRAQRRAGA
jgi:electron transport complex protein RnfB